ncbi:hypothetical protein D9M73_265340 [compost metagenome]
MFNRAVKPLSPVKKPATSSYWVLSTLSSLVSSIFSVPSFWVVIPNSDRFAMPSFWPDGATSSLRTVVSRERTVASPTSAPATGVLSSPTEVTDVRLLVTPISLL